MYKVFSTLLFIISFLAATTAYANGIVLTPPKFEFDADPGQVIEATVSITNKNDTPLVLNSEAKDYHQFDTRFIIYDFCDFYDILY